jgi:hypothetical protein
MATVPHSEEPLGYYRERARTVREAAESVRDPESKETLLRLAQAYEEWVQRLERGEAPPSMD